MAMPAVSSVSNGYRLSEINLNFINPEKYTQGMSIKRDGALKECPVQVLCYSDFEKLERDFNFHKNGFQFCTVVRQQFSRNYSHSRIGRSMKYLVSFKQESQQLCRK